MAAFALDVALYLLLTSTDVLGERWEPLAAKFVSAAAATVISFIGNYKWVFAGTAAVLSWRTLLRFAVTNVSALAFTLAPLFVAQDVMHNKSLLVANIAGNIIGVLLGSALRLLSYRHWVFPAPPARAAA